MEKEYYEAQVRYINEIRSIRHDIQAHMIVLQHYLDAGNYEKASEYLREMKCNQISAGLCFRDTGNDLVNAIVSDVLGRSKKEIVFQINDLLPEDFPMSEYDTCTLFSNVISNACEACEKLTHTEPVIVMDVCKTMESYSIVIENPIEWNVQLDSKCLLTSKKDQANHGFGTKNMMKVVKKYHGQIEYLITENRFRVKITYCKEEK